MGKWNQRWLPRRRYYNYEDPPPESTYWPSHNAQPESYGCQNSVPSWEKQFCTLVGSVPWEKVAFAKHYMHCHENVVKWNDSAGEEAFDNAKGRFWAAINGHPCEIPLPDPNMYIDEIDWNPHIDPEIIIDLDRAYFNPDEGGKYNNVLTTNQKAHKSFSGNNLSWHGNHNNADNNWESDVKGTGALEDVRQGWNQLGGSVNQSDNPWEQHFTKDTEALKEITWGSSGDKSWGWTQGQTFNEQSKKFDSQNVGSEKVKGWGGADRWGTNVNEWKKSNCGDAPWSQSMYQGDGRGKRDGWGDSREKNWGQKQCGNQNYEPKNWDSRSGRGAWGALNGGCRKREGSHHYSSRYKSSRFQSDDWGTGQHWREGRNQKRVGFS